MKTYIGIKNLQDERIDIIQYANSKKQAKLLIEKVMEPLKVGFKYVIITN